MKHIITLLSFIFITNFAFSQTEKIEVIQNKVDDKVVLLVKNNTESDYQVTLNVDLYNAKISTANPYAQVVPANSEMEYMTITPANGGAYQYSISYTSRKLKTPVTPTVANFDFKEDNIYIFTKQGCGRCRIALETLNENNIVYTELNTTSDSNNNEVLWKKLSEENSNINSVTMPVIVINETTYYNIPNLSTFMNEFVSAQ